jgi:hypothetical protein
MNAKRTRKGRKDSGKVWRLVPRDALIVTVWDGPVDPEALNAELLRLMRRNLRGAGSQSVLTSRSLGNAGSQSVLTRRSLRSAGSQSVLACRTFEGVRNLCILESRSL